MTVYGNDLINLRYKHDRKCDLLIPVDMNDRLWRDNVFSLCTCLWKDQNALLSPVSDSSDQDRM